MRDPTMLFLSLALAGTALARPVRPVPQGGTVQYINKTHVKVHYVTSGQDSTTQAYAESIAVFAEHFWNEFDERGWALPAPDYGAGGDDRLDFYLTGGGVGGNTPDTAYTNPYPDGACCFHTYNPRLAIDDFLRAVVCHELGHSIQGRYDNGIGAGNWAYEHTSWYTTDLNFPGWYEIYRRSSDPVSPLTMPWLAVNNAGEYNGKGGLWFLFLDHCFGADTPRRVWDLMGRHAGEHTFYDMDSVLRRDFSSSLDYALGHYAIWRYFTGMRDDGLHFLRAESLRACSVHARHTTFPASGSAGREGPRGPGGMNVIEFVTGGSSDLEISFDGQDEYRWRVYVICLRGGVYYEQRMLLDDERTNTGSIRIPAALAETAVLIPVVMNWGSAGYMTPALSYSYVATLTEHRELSVTDHGRPAVFLGPELFDPAGTGARFTVALPAGSRGRLEVLDGAGRLCWATELTGTGRPEQVCWDRADRRGRRVAGVCFARLSTQNSAVTAKAVLVR